MGTSHSIYLSIKEAELKDTTTTIQINKNGKKSGRIEFNKSHFVYYPKNTKEGHGYDVYWHELEVAIISYCEKRRGRNRSQMLLPEKLKNKK